MLTILSFAIFCCIAFAWLYGIVFLLMAIENRRFWRSHHARPAPSLEDFPKVLVIIPCKGMEHRLRENLTFFLQQDHPNFEVCFVVESKSDSAFNLITNVMRENRHVNSRLVVAGRATDCGQKVHNLLAASAELPQGIEILAFADSDACPDTNWLRWLVHGIGGEKVGARTGYRWLIPSNKRLPTLIGCTLNNAFASLMGRHSHVLVWGGSWAIHRLVFESVGLRQAWHGIVGDDMVASRVLRLSGLKINFEPNCVCTSRTQFNTWELFSFFRRQLIVARKYQTAHWATGFAFIWLSQLGYWSGVFLGFYWLAQGNNNGWWLLVSSTLLYGLGVTRAVIRQNLGRSVTPDWKAFRTARRFDILAGPLTGIAALVLMTCSSLGNQINWRGIRYHINRGGSVLQMGRKMQVEPWPLAEREPPTNEWEQTPAPDVLKYEPKRIA